MRMNRLLIGAAGLLSSSLLLADVEQSFEGTRNHLRNDITTNHYTSQFAQLLAFETEPDISGSTFYIDDGIDTEMDVYKLPLQTKLFSSNGNDYYGRLGLNYATLKSADVLDGLFIDNRIDSKWKTYSGTLGLIADVPVNDDLVITFAVDAGIARLENEANYRGDLVADLAPLMDGILFNWTTNASIVSGVTGLKYKKSLTTVDLDLQAHYTHSYVSSFSESRDFSGFSEHTNTLGLSADVTHPLNTKAMGYPLSGIIHMGYVAFMGNNREAMGFSNYGELGYSIKFDISNESLPVKSFNLGAKGIMGDNNLIGWSLILGYKF